MLPASLPPPSNAPAASCRSPACRSPAASSSAAAGPGRRGRRGPCRCRPASPPSRPCSSPACARVQPSVGGARRRKGFEEWKSAPGRLSGIPRLPDRRGRCALQPAPAAACGRRRRVISWRQWPHCRARRRWTVRAQHAAAQSAPRAASVAGPTAARTAAAEPQGVTHQLLGLEHFHIAPAHVRLVLVHGQLDLGGAAQHDIGLPREASVALDEQDIHGIDALLR